MDKQLVIKYLNHSCTSGELKEIEEWILDNQSNSECLFDAEQIWNLKHELYYSDEKILEETYTHLISTHGIAETKPIAKLDRRTKLATHYWWQIGVAAVIVTLLVVNLFSPCTAPISEAEELAYNSVIVPFGQRASVILADGTRINLNAGSTLRYPARFTGQTRNVDLEGEGFFKVAHDSSHPFIVKTKMLNVKVLGTMFNLRAYTSEQTEVTLTEGKVEVESNDQANKITMRPRDQVLYSEDNGMVLKQDMNTDFIFSWIKGEGVYVNKLLAEICADLERRFNVSITLDNPELAKTAFTCHFQENATINQILKLLSDTRKLNFHIDNDNIHIINP